MKQLLLSALLCGFALLINAQQLRADELGSETTITRDYHDLSLSKVLEDLNQATSDKTIYFIYDELEDFTVTAHFSKLSIEEAVREVIGFYPMKVTYEKDAIFIECTQKETTKVMGRVVDSQGHPIEFANISLLEVTDGAFINGSVSNENGDFVIPCQAQRVIVKLSYIGYKAETRQVSVGEIGVVTMQPETYTIDGVEVKGEIPQYKMTNGGMSVDIQHSLLHDIGNADDMLSMLPLIQGRDGKFTVLAKGEPEIYINNKKVRNMDELKQLKSSDVKSVDIITAPGARYNAEVNAVIRIKTLKPQGEGLSLMATSQTWRNNKWNNYDDLTLKYHVAGLEAFANVAFDWSHYSGDQDIDQELHISRDTFNIHAFAPVRSRWAELSYKAGLNYDFNADHSAGLSFSSQKRLYEHFNNDMTQHYLKNGAYYGDILLKTNINRPDKPVRELNMYYIGKVGQLGIDLNATWLRRDSEDQIEQQEYSHELGDRPINTVNWEKNTMAAAKLILSYPIWKGELSFGSEATSTESHGHNYNEEDIIPEADTDTEEQNIAGFAEYNLQLGQWTLNGGLRYEHVANDVHQFGLYKPELSRNYNDWFPSLSAAWQKNKWGIQLSYSKRITRPRYNLLSSIIVYDSRMLYEGGNPLLRPSVRQSIDLSITYSWLNFVTGFTRENDLISHIGKVYDAEKEIAIFQPMNFDHQDRVYATLVASPKFGFWQPTATLHYYQQMFDAEAYGAPMKLNKPEFSFSLQSWFVINPTTKAVLQASHTGSNHWAFMYRNSSFILNARIQKTFLKGQLTVSLYANDIFRTYKTKLTTYYEIGSTQQDDYGYTQQVGLTLSYNFNATRSKYRGTGAGNEEKSRF